MDAAGRSTEWQLKALGDVNVGDVVAEGRIYEVARGQHRTTFRAADPNGKHYECSGWNEALMIVYPPSVMVAA